MVKIGKRKCRQKKSADSWPTLFLEKEIGNDVFSVHVSWWLSFSGMKRAGNLYHPISPQAPIEDRWRNERVIKNLHLPSRFSFAIAPITGKKAIARGAINVRRFRECVIWHLCEQFLFQCCSKSVQTRGRIMFFSFVFSFVPMHIPLGPVQPGVTKYILFCFGKHGGRTEIFPSLVQLRCRLSFDGSFQNKATRKEREEREKRRRHWNALSERLNIN